jgi:hypothetical protein
MTPHSPPISRRRLLAGIGAVGLVTVGTGLGQGALSTAHPYTRYTYALPDGASATGGAPQPRLTLAWYQTYNGEAIDSPAAEPSESAFADTAVYVDDVTGPVVDLPNLLPGDSGSLGVGLLVEGAPANVWFALRPVGDDGPLSAFTENGVVEPEATAGDTTADRGELQNYLAFDCWYDTGVLGTNAGLSGACNGRRDVGEQAIASGLLFATDDDGTFTHPDVARLANGVRLDDETLVGGTGCLTPDEPRCLGFDWRFAGDEENDAQTDGVSFELAVAVTECVPGTTAVNPFAPVFEEGSS